MSVTPYDIATAIGRPAASITRAESDQWDIWVGDARLLIAARQARETGISNLSLLDQPTLDYVVREAVVAHLRNPDDVTQVDVAVDDGRVSRRYASSSGRVAILPEWWELLFPSSVGGAFTVTPYSDPDAVTALTW